jgi:hypothetical protein
MTTATTDLQATRARLALDLADGVEGAEEALAEVEQAILAAAVEAERQRLADEERERRRAAEADTHAEAARTAAQEELRALAHRSADVGDMIDRALDQLCTALGAFRQLDNAMRIVGRVAGVQMSSHRSDAVKARMLGEVARVFPGNIDHTFSNPSGETFGQAHRRSLGSLLDEPVAADEPTDEAE